MPRNTILLVLLLAAATPAQDGGSAAAARVDAFLAAARSGQQERLEAAATDVLAAREETLPMLVKRIAKRSSDEIVCVIQLLARGGAWAWLSELTVLEGHLSGRVRSELVRFAGQARPGELSLGLLGRALDDADSQVRRRALDGLLRQRAFESALLRSVTARLLDEDPWVVGQAARLLAAWPAGEAKADPVVVELEGILPRLRDASGTSFFTVLMRRKGEGVDPLFSRGLAHARSGVVVAALQVIARSGRRRHLPTVRVLAGRPGATGVAAVRCLGDLRDPAAVPILVDLMAAAPQGVYREALAVGLRAITGQTFGYDVRRWRRWLSERS